MEALVSPVFVVSVLGVGAGCAQHRLEGENITAAPLSADGTGEGFLTIPARLVGEGVAGVVEGERVIAIVRIQVEQGEIQLQVVTRLVAQLAAGNSLIEVVGVLAVQVAVVHIAVGLLILHRKAVTELLG